MKQDESCERLDRAEGSIEGYVDASSHAKRAGISDPVHIEPSLYAKFAELDDVNDPLFRLFVPFRFIAARCITATRLEFVVGKGRICDEGIRIVASYRGDPREGYYFVLQGKDTAELN